MFSFFLQSQSVFFHALAGCCFKSHHNTAGLNLGCVMAVLYVHTGHMCRMQRVLFSIFSPGAF